MPLVSKTFADIITFTRASTGTYFNAAGTLTSAAIDAPRLDYNPATLAAQGLLIEEALTNSIRNNTMVGAVAGTPGTSPTNWATQITTTTGLTTSVVGTGTESGITYLDIRVNGTASGAGSLDVFLENANGVATLTGKTWTGSVYTKLQSGSLTGISTPQFRLYEYTSGIVFVTAQSGSIATPTNAGLATQRTAATLTTNGGATTAFIRPLLNYAIANGAAIDITLRIGLPQLELGAFATSVIPTTTTALTRAADVASVNTLSPWFNASEGTLYAESVIARVPSIAGIGIAQFDDGTSSNRIRSFYRAAGTTGSQITLAGSAVVDLTPTGVLTANQNLKLAFAYKTNDFAASGNGGAAVTSGSGVLPTVNCMSLGNSDQWLNGYLRRITYYPRRLSNAELQSLTA